MIRPQYGFPMAGVTCCGQTMGKTGARRVMAAKPKENPSAAAVIRRRNGLPVPCLPAAAQITARALGTGGDWAGDIVSLLPCVIAKNDPRWLEFGLNRPRPDAVNARVPFAHSPAAEPVEVDFRPV